MIFLKTYYLIYGTLKINSHSITIENVHFIVRKRKKQIYFKLNNKLFKYTNHIHLSILAQEYL